MGADPSPGSGYDPNASDSSDTTYSTRLSLSRDALATRGAAESPDHFTRVPESAKRSPLWYFASWPNSARAVPVSADFSAVPDT